MNDKDLLQIKQLVESAYLSLKETRDLLERAGGGSHLPPSHSTSGGLSSVLETPDGNIIQGVFDGQMMVGADGKKYSVPANYASKSKLVEGDQLKLTIKHDGTFVFKQIGPVERKRLKGILFRDEDIEQYRVVAEEKSYKVLTASITYFKGEPGDEVIILVPQQNPSVWAAVEHVLKVSSPSATSSPSSGNSSHPASVQEGNTQANEIDFADVLQ